MFVAESIVDKRAVLAALLPPRVDVEQVMSSFAEVVRKAGATVVGAVVQRRGVSRSSRPGGNRAGPQPGLPPLRLGANSHALRGQSLDHVGFAMLWCGLFSRRLAVPSEIRRPLADRADA